VAHLYGAAAALRESAGAPIWPDETLRYDRSVAAVHTALGDATFMVAWEAGRTTPLDRLIAELEQEHRSGDDRTTPDVALTT
jgi:hypothetical protein